MFKISKLADYAVVVLATLAKSDEALMTASGISLKSRLPEPTVAKVLKILSRADLLESARGANGGYKLMRSADHISVLDIISAVEGPVALTTCVDSHKPSCDYHSSCLMHGRWDGVNTAVRDAMAGVTLSDMLRGEQTRIKTIKGKEGLHEQYL